MIRPQSTCDFNTNLVFLFKTKYIILAFNKLTHFEFGRMHNMIRKYQYIEELYS